MPAPACSTEQPGHRFFIMKNKQKTQSTRDQLCAMQAAMGWSDYTLAAASGVDRSLIGRYRRGQIDVGTQKADAIRAAMSAAHDGRGGGQ